MSIDPIASLPRQISAPTKPAAADDRQKVRPAAATTAASKLHVRKAEHGPRFVYEFRDPETGEMLRQFPSEAALALGALIDEIV